MDNHVDNTSINFSVVIPLYNKEKQICRTITSVLSQTYQKFEIIVVDDGSTDNSINELKTINDPRLRLIKQSNNGVSAARNKGIEHAKYNYIAFIDADDFWNEEFLNSIKKLIIKYPNAGAYATGYKIVNQLNEDIIPRSILKFGEGRKEIIDDYFKYAILTPIVTASSVVIPQRTFKKIGVFLNNLNRGEDLEMWSRIALNYPIAFDSNIYVVYFNNYIDQATKKPPVVEKTFSFYAEEFQNKYKKNKNFSIHAERYFNQKVINKARLYVISGNIKKGQKILKTIKFYPKNWKQYVKLTCLILINKIKRN